MNIIHLGNDAVEFDVHTALTVGTFDGVHRGHQSIIERMKTVAKQFDERTVVVTFDPHPQIVLQRPGRHPLRLLTTIDERCHLLESVGVGATVIIPFTKEFSATPAEDFIRDVVVNTIGTRHFFIGHDHMFGKDRTGDEELLRTLGNKYEFEVEPIPPLLSEGTVVSSTKIRTALKDSDVEGAARMLGRPYEVTGHVVRGDGRGRTLGIPTANIQPSDVYKLMPGNGVYIVSSLIREKEEIGMASIGVRPTFTNDTEPVLEVNYLDVEADLYGSEITVRFHRFIRPEQRYDTTDEFLKQLQHDKMQSISFKQTFLTRS